MRKINHPIWIMGFCLFVKTFIHLLKGHIYKSEILTRGNGLYSSLVTGVKLHSAQSQPGGGAPQE